MEVRIKKNDKRKMKKELREEGCFAALSMTRGTAERRINRDFPKQAFESIQTIRDYIIQDLKIIQDNIPITTRTILFLNRD